MDLQSDNVQKLISTIVETAHPVRILIFGSVARGEDRPASDLDVLVVMPEGIHRRQTAQKIDMALIGSLVPSDIVVVTEADLLKHAAKPYMIYRDALRDGKEVYRAA